MFLAAGQRERQCGTHRQNEAVLSSLMVAALPGELSLSGDILKVAAHCYAIEDVTGGHTEGLEL